MKLTPGWALIRVNFDPIKEIGPKVGDGRSFVSGCSFTRLRYIVHKEGSDEREKSMYTKEKTFDR